MTSWRHHRCYLHHALYDAEELIRHVAEGQVYPGGGFDYAALMSERVKAQLAVVMTHSGVAYAAKRDIPIGYVHDGVIDTAST